MASFALANEMPGQRPSSRMRQSSSTLQHSTLANATDPPSGGEKRTNGNGLGNGVEPHGNNRHASNQAMEDHAMPDVDDSNDKGQSKDVTGNHRLQEYPPPGSQESAIMSDGDAMPSSRGRSNVAREPELSGNMPRSAGGEESKHSRSGSNHILKQIASFNRSPIMGRRELPGTEDDSSASESRPASRAKRVSRPSRRQESRVRSPSPDRVSPPPTLEPDAPELEEEDGVEDNDVDDPDEPKYCYCGRGSYGTMIGCENPNCEREWFHLECVGLKTAPNDDGEFKTSVLYC